MEPRDTLGMIIYCEEEAQRPPPSDHGVSPAAFDDRQHLMRPVPAHAEVVNLIVLSELFGKLPGERAGIAHPDPKGEGAPEGNDVPKNT